MSKVSESPTAGTAVTAAMGLKALKETESLVEGNPKPEPKRRWASDLLRPTKETELKAAIAMII